MTTMTVTIQGCVLQGGQQALDFHICCAEFGISTGSSTVLDLARPPSQVVASIKATARQVLIDVGGPNIPSDNDIYRFGGPT